MKKTPFSHPFRHSLRIILLLAIVALSLGTHGTTPVFAADPPVNDNFVDRTLVTSLPYNPSGTPLDTTGGSRQVDEPDPGDYAGGCEGPLLRAGRNSVWYEYSPGATTTPVYLDTSGSTTNIPDPLNGGFYEYDTYISVFVKTNEAAPAALTNLNMVACNDSPNNDTNQAQLAFTAQANKTYYISVVEYDGVLGDLNTYPGYDGGSLIFKMSVALTISGNVGVKGVALTYKGGATTSDSNGNYSLAIPSGFTDTVTPSLFGTVFTPPSRTYTGITSSTASQDYVSKRFNDVSRWTQSFDLSHGWTVAQYVRTAGDVNGDGKEDVVGFGLDGIYVATTTNTGTAFNSITRWSTSLAAANGWTVKDYVRTVGDVSGDGCADAVGFGLDGVYVATSNCSNAFNTVIKWSNDFNLNKGWTVAGFVRTVGDVNGDGKDDLVGYGLDGIYVAISTGIPGPNGFNPIQKWSDSLSSLNGWNVTDYARTVADVNGDGKADAVGFGLDGVYVAISNGTNAFNPVTKWSNDFNLNKGWTVAGFVRTLGDVNGDGKDDVVGFGLDGVYVAISNGVNQFGPITKWSGIMASANGWTVKDYVRMTGDISGDGLDDLIGFGLDGVYIAR